MPGRHERVPGGATASGASSVGDSLKFAGGRSLPSWKAHLPRNTVAVIHPGAAWKVKPSWYQVLTEDRTIDPELDRFLARRMNATTIEIASSHVSLLSHPREIADLILRAAGHTR